MFTFSRPTSKTQLQPSLRLRTFNGWTNTIERMRAFAAPPVKPRKTMLWLRRRNSSPPTTQSVERAQPTYSQSISPPFPLNYSSFPLVVPPISPHPAEVVETTVPMYSVGTKDYPGFEPFCTKVVLVASTDASRPCRIRRIHTRKELPWIPVSKPLPPLPLSACVPESKTQSVTVASRSSIYSNRVTLRNSDVFDDGLDDLSLFLRRIAYDAISASTIHRHLGFMEDGGRVLPLGRTTRCLRRSISPSRRYSSLMGVSLAIMEGRLPKALMSVV